MVKVVVITVDGINHRIMHKILGDMGGGMDMGEILVGWVLRLLGNLHVEILGVVGLMVPQSNKGIFFLSLSTGCPKLFSSYGNRAMFLYASYQFFDVA